MIEVTDVKAGYIPGVHILNGISAAFPDGQTSGIVGPNGAGKSTLLKAIYGFVTISSGSIEYHGKDLTAYDPTDMIDSVGFAYIPQERSVFPDLTVRENLELGCWTIRSDSERTETAIERVYDTFPVLEEKNHQPAGEMSGGQQRMLEFGRSLLTDPEVVLIDEPSVGLAPKLTEEVYASIDQLQREDVTIILVDQNVQAAVDHCDQLFVLDNGNVDVQGSVDDVDVRNIVSDWVA